MTRDDQRPRIAVIADVRGWAFHNIAISIQRLLDHRFSIDVVYIEDHADYGTLLRSLLREGNHDLVHALWREALVGPHVLDPVIGDEGGPQDDGARLRTALEKVRLTVSVYDHLLLDGASIDARRYYYRHVLSGYTVSSGRLARAYGALPFFPAPSAVIEDGVDLERFRPERLGRFMEDRPLVVGWVGNSRWGAEGGADPKGFHTILLPALERLKAEGVPVEGRFADRQVRMTPQSEMPAYYGSIDVLVCASDTEGTPNPVLEAMACGVPFVSTDVGLVSDVAGSEQRACVLAERSVEAMVDALRRLAADRSILDRLSRENLARIPAFTRAVEAEKWAAFFDDALAKAPRDFAAVRPVADMARGMRLEHDRVLEDHRAAIRSNEKMIDERDALLRLYEQRMARVPDAVWQALERPGARSVLRALPALARRIIGLR